MRALLCTIALALVVLPIATHGCAGLDTRADPELVARHFGQYNGCFLMTDLEDDTTWEVGDQCDAQVAPASTFKLLHSLIGLQTGVIDTGTVFPYDGRRQPFHSWEHDQTLDSAFKYSVVWAYQQLALKIGQPEMDRWLAKVGYGHGQRDSLTGFWLDGSWTVSARDQLDLMVRFDRGELPFAPEHLETVRRIMDEPWDSGGWFGGKTGTHMHAGRLQAGWFIGHLDKPGTKLAFVTLIRADDDARGHKAKAITKAILHDLGY